MPRDCSWIKGMLPSSPFSLCSLIYGYCSRGMMRRAVEVLELMNDEKVKYPFSNFVYSSVISSFCNGGKPELAVRFYESADGSGAFRPNLVSYTAVANALCQLGRFDEVSKLACRMEQEGMALDVIFYSCWICGYFKEDLLEEALQKYGQMVGKRIRPDTISYTILIDGFVKEGNVEKAVGFLSKMERDGLKPNLVTYTAIMTGFCKKGKLEEGRAVFRMVDDLGMKVDEYMFATLIDGFSRKGDFDQVYTLLDDMEKKGIDASVVTYNTVINGLCKLGKTSEADKISKRVPVDTYTYSTLLHGYIKEENFLGIMEIWRRVEEAEVQLDVVMCNVLIKALFMVGDSEAACALYKGMAEMGVVANSVTYCTMIDGCCKLHRNDSVLEIFYTCRTKSMLTVACCSHIIKGLCMNGMVDMATTVFTESTGAGLDLDVNTYKLLIRMIFKEKGVDGVQNLIHRVENLKKETCDILFNEAICFLCKRSFVEAACNVYMVLRRNRSTSCNSYYSILKGLIGNRQKWLSQLFLCAFMKEFGFSEHKVHKILLYYLCMKNTINVIQFLNKISNISQSFTFPVTVLKALTKDGRALDAYELVMAAKDSHPVMNIVDYTFIIDGLCKGGHFVKALDLCDFAKRKEITLNIVTYNSVINGLSHQGCLIEALRLFDSLERINLVPSEITYATLIDALCKEKHLVEAKKLFQRMILNGLSPNTRTYNSLIDNYCKLSQTEEAWQLLLELEARHLKPDGFTLSSMISGYCQRGELEGALEFYFEYKGKGLVPDFLGFVYLLRSLCTKGRMEEARSMLREMLESPSVVELLKEVDYEVEPESMKSFLAFLCEQGSIQEAVTVLGEVGYRFFPVRARGSHYGRSREAPQHYDCETMNTEDLKSCTFFHETEMETELHDVTEKEVLEKYSKFWRQSKYHDFSYSYSIVASLCLRGELQKANKLVQEMISGLNGDS